jgi:hypothetical protein
MDSFIYYDDIETSQTDINRITLIEDSLNRTLISNREKEITKYTNNYCCYTFLMYIFIGLLLIILIVGVIFIIKHI